MSRSKREKRAGAVSRGGTMSVDPRSAPAFPGPFLNSTFQPLPGDPLFVNSTTPSGRSRDQNVPAAAGTAKAAAATTRAGMNAVLKELKRNTGLNHRRRC